MGTTVWLVVVAIAALACPGCATNTPAEGLNAPCTRTSNCQAGLVCGLKGFCAGPDASDPDASDGDEPPDAQAGVDGEGDVGDSSATDGSRVD